MSDAPRSAPVAAFDAEHYWEGRLGDDWSLRGVGLRRLGSNFNAWAYRRRGERFEAIVEEFVPDRAGRRVLDVGSGTGFYLDAWLRLGVADLTGLDLSTVAASKLQGRYPELEILRADISDGPGSLAPGTFDVISCMDVLFHVVDHRRYAAALQTICTLLRPGGVFVWSDMFVHGPEEVQEHIVIRSLYRIEALLDHAGLAIAARRPMFFLMNEPRDTRSPWPLRAWKGFMGLASTSETLGELAGRITYTLDGWLDTRCTESPTTEIMVCVKR